MSRPADETTEFAGRAQNARSVGRLAGSCLLVFLLGFSSGCYTFEPVATSPTAGTRVVLGLNDQGRATLGQSVGPAAEIIEGTLQAKNDSAYVIAVSSVRYFNGGTNIWSGEPLTVSTALVQQAQERRFSPSRTALTVALSAAAVLSLILTRTLFGSSSPDKTVNPGPPTGS
ncbi:MAG: hypothetical protein M3Z54_12060 [Gemmatimonadota bacterium]|nr:hypothetical protein [Gemmatimonadota bacterium]